MAPSLHVDPASAVPIWRQIEDGVRRLVAAGGIAPGSPVPSVRDLSRTLRVNPATVAKAYQRLADAGVLTVRRGEGTFVAEAPPALPRGERARVLREEATRFASVALTTGAELDEATSELRSVWGRLERGGSSTGHPGGTRGEPR